MPQRLQPFALTPVFVTLFRVTACCVELELEDRTELCEDDCGIDLLRNTTPPNEPRIVLVTLPLPTEILF